MDFTHSLRIDAPVDVVFGFLEDERRLKTWMEELESTIYLADYDRSNPVGARFTQRIREGAGVTEYDGEIIVHSRPHRLAVRLWNDDLTAEIDYLLHADDGGTRLEYSAELRHATGLGRAIAAIFGWLTRRSLIDQLGALKRVAEAAVVEVEDEGEGAGGTGSGWDRERAPATEGGASDAAADRAVAAAEAEAETEAAEAAEAEWR